MRVLLAVIGIFSTASVLTGCDGDVCVPGESRACVGPGGCSGGQRCADDGSRFEACLCTAGIPCGDVVCEEGEMCCADTCVDTESSTEHCGACDNFCSSFCSDGRCEPGIMLRDSGPSP